MKKLIYSAAAIVFAIGGLNLTTLPAFAATDTTSPSVPTNLVASPASSARIDLSWTASTDNVGVTGYDVYRNGTLLAMVSGTTFSDMGLLPSTSYGYTVAAFDAAGNLSAQSLSISAATLASSTDMTVPSMPSGLSATVVSPSQINLGWIASSDNVGVTGYNVYRNGIIVGTSGTTTFSNTGLVASTTYAYAIAAFDATGNLSSQSNTVSVTTPTDNAAPSIPANLTATAISSSQINLGWTASTDNVGVTGYNVYRNGTLIGTSSSSSFNDTGLVASTTYNYTVAAFDAAGNLSGQSTSASATTLATTVTPPSDNEHEHETADVNENGRSDQEHGDMHHGHEATHQEHQSSGSRHTGRDN
jgi:chitodextrinase